MISAYLLDGHQRVGIENVFSEWRTVKTRVPQGSLLGPLLFNLFINDLNVINTSLRLYADDTTEYASDSSPMVLEYNINQDLRFLLFSQWITFNYLKINESKTQAIIIGPSNYDFNFKLGESEIELSDWLKILAVTLKRKL